MDYTNKMVMIPEMDTRNRYLTNKKPKRQITIRDVAKKAGVSPTTVSRVLTGKSIGQMQEKTKKKVLKAIKELEYIPNKYARALKQQKTGVIGVLIPDISDIFFSSIVRGIEKIAYQNKYSVVVCDSGNSVEKEENYIDILLQEMVEGLIFIPSSRKSDKVKKLIERKIVVVLVDRELDNFDLPVVICNDFDGSYKLTKYLVDLGYKTIGFIKGSPEVTTAEERYRGYMQALKDNNIGCNQAYVKQGMYTFESGYKAAREYLKMKHLPQAIIAANDLMAIGAIRLFERFRFKIPSDIGIAGFGDVIFAKLMNPRLTTIRIPAFQMGQEATKILFNLLKGKSIRKTRRVIETKLIKGNSCILMKP